jgi:hypothetical protein
MVKAALRIEKALNLWLTTYIQTGQRIEEQQFGLKPL